MNKRRPMNPDVARKVDAEIAKLMAETSKINSEARWYPFVVLASVFGAAVAAVKLLTG